ncbi:unnamed protein product, partial [Meganyctiphanes norvegica]
EVDEVLEKLEILKPNQEEPNEDAEIQNQYSNRPNKEENQGHTKFRKLCIEEKSDKSNQIDKLASQITDNHQRSEVNANKIEKLQEDIQQVKVDNVHLKAENENKIEKMKEEIQRVKADNYNLKVESKNKIEKMQEEIDNLKAERENLKERLTNLEDRGLCIGCYGDRVNCWLIPCHHWVLCLTCYRYRLQDRKCPVCRQDIQSAVPFYGM